MKGRCHHRVSEEVAKVLWPSADCEMLLAAVRTFDWPGTDVRHHPTHTTDNVRTIQKLVRRARYQYLQAGFSEELQCQLGNIFHLIQDGFISSDRMEDHNLVEAAVSRRMDQCTFYGIQPDTLSTQTEVFEFIRREVRPIQDAEKILLSSFRACLSLARAVTSPKVDFELGQQANNLIRDVGLLLDEIERDAAAWEAKADKAFESYETYFAGQVGAAEAELRRLQVDAAASVWRRIKSVLSREDRRHKAKIDSLQRQKTRLLERSKAAKAPELNRLLDRAGQAASLLQRLEGIATERYQSMYDAAAKDAGWQGVNMREFRRLTELKSFSVEHERTLDAVLLPCVRKARDVSIPVESEVLSTFQS